MSYILWAPGEEAFVTTVLNGGAVSPALPVKDANPGGFGIGMAATTGGVWAGNGSVSLALKQRLVGTNIATTIAEIGQVTTVNNGGYSRKQIIRGNAGWPAAGNAGNSDNYFSTAPQVSFAFTGGGPNLGGPALSPATLWMVCKSVGPWTNSSTPGPAQDLLFGADLGNPQNFAGGSTENIIPTYKQT